jgi:hypothetical protein
MFFQVDATCSFVLSCLEQATKASGSGGANGQGGAMSETVRGPFKCMQHQRVVRGLSGHLLGENY